MTSPQDNNKPLSELTIETYQHGDGAHLGRYFRFRNGKKQYLDDYEIWLCEDLLDGRNGIYREGD